MCNKKRNAHTFSPQNFLPSRIERFLLPLQSSAHKLLDVYSLIREGILIIVLGKLRRITVIINSTFESLFELSF